MPIGEPPTLVRVNTTMEVPTTSSGRTISLRST